MLTIEIRVNGSIVTAMSAINTAAMDGDRYIYDCNGVTFNMDEKIPPRVWHSTVKHKRSDGINKLAAVLMKAAGNG